MRIESRIGRPLPANIGALLERFVEQSVKTYDQHIKRIILYGSYARCDYGKDSDIDLMVLVDYPRERISELDEGDYRAANNRAYYAIFHALDACLALKQLGFKRHGQAIGAFNKEFVVSGIFPREFGRKINEAEEIRRKAIMMIST